MKIIILIISNNEPEYYKNMKDVWKKYMNLHENIKSYFIEFSEKINDEVLLNNEDNIILIKGKDSVIPGVLDKTIKSIKYFVNNNIDFDYIVRTNLSTVINLKKLHYFLENNKFDYGGPRGILNFNNNELQISKLSFKKNFKTKFNKININNRFFASGTGIIMSKNAVFKLLNEDIYYSIIDDVLIGLYLSQFYKCVPINRQDIVNNKQEIASINNINNEDNVFIYRCKDENGKHKKTVEAMNMLIKMFYNL